MSSFVSLEKKKIKSKVFHYFSLSFISWSPHLSFTLSQRRARMWENYAVWVMEPALHEADIYHNGAVFFNHVLILLNVRMNCCLTLSLITIFPVFILQLWHFSKSVRCSLQQKRTHATPAVFGRSKLKFESCTFLIIPASTLMVPKNVFTQTREAPGLKSSAAPSANCTRSLRAGRDSLSRFSLKLFKSFGPKCPADWLLSSSSSWIQTLLRTLKPRTTASPQPPQKKLVYLYQLTARRATGNYSSPPIRPPRGGMSLAAVRRQRFHSGLAPFK